MRDGRAALVWSVRRSDPGRHARLTRIVSRVEIYSERTRDRCRDRSHKPTGRSPFVGSLNAQTLTGKPRRERPDRIGRGATPRARRRGRSRHGLLTNPRRRGSDTGGTERRPIATRRSKVVACDANRKARPPSSPARSRVIATITSSNASGQPTRRLGCPRRLARSQPLTRRQPRG